MTFSQSKRLVFRRASIRAGLVAVSSALSGVLGSVTHGQTVVYTGADPTTPGTFDTTSTNFSYNGAAAHFNSSDSVLFNDTASGPTNIVVSNSNVTPVAITFNNSSLAYAFNAGGGMVVGATASLYVTGGGAVSLNQSNSYGGQTNVSLGTLTVGATGSIGTGDLDIAAGQAVNLNDAAQTIGGLNGAGSVNLSNTTLQVTPATSGAFAGSLAGTGSVAVNGLETFTGSSSFNGTFNILGGTVSAPSTVTLSKAGSSFVFGGSAYVGGNSSNVASGILNLTGGTFQSSSTASTVYVGNNNLNVGVINQSGGNAYLFALQLGSKAGSSGTYNLSGGTLNMVSIDATAVQGTSTLIFNGGVLNTLRQYGQFGTSLNIIIGAGGMKISSKNPVTGAQLGAALQLQAPITSGVPGGTDGGITVDPNSTNGNIVFYAQASYSGPTSTPGSVTFVNGTAPIVLLGNITTGANLNPTYNPSLTYFAAGTVTLGGNNSFLSGVLAQGTGTLQFLPQSVYTGNAEVQQGFFNVSGGTNTTNGFTVDNNFHPNVAGSAFIAANNSGGIYTRYTGAISVVNGLIKIGLASSQSTRTLLLPTSFYMNISGGSPIIFLAPTTATFDITNNDMIDPGAANADIGIDTNLVKRGYNGGAWTGIGFKSSAAAADISHLTAVGVIANSTDPNGFTQLYGTGTNLGLFDGFSPQPLDVLIKYTYYGDANLDGKVDGSDYSLIDSAFLNNRINPNNPSTGWFNGDFNYDGVIDGSDYTLIDNAFNAQGGQLASAMVSATAQIGGNISTSAVPEPAFLSIAGLGIMALLGRRRITSELKV